MSNPATNVILTTVVPSFGALISFVLYFSSFPTVAQVRKEILKGRKDIKVNALPVLAMFLNCLGWLLYGLWKQDYFILAGNASGFILAVAFGMNIYASAFVYPQLIDTSKEHRNKMLAIEIAFYSLFTLLLVVYCFVVPMLGPENETLQQGIAGITTNLMLLFFYISPLSTMMAVIKTKDATSIKLPLAFASIFNGGLWFVYGLTVSDPYIYGPNAVGVFSSLVQLGCKVVFRKKNENPV